MDRSFTLTYERVSTDDQKYTKSCDDQKTVNDRYLTTNGWKLAENADYRDEGISGSITDRPGLQDLLIRCQEDKTIKSVVITETDRLARGNLAYLTIREALKKYGVKIVAVTQPMIDDSDEGEMLGEIMGAVNGFFSKLTRRKSMRALDEKAARGIYPSWAPLGYKNVNVGTEEQPNRIIEVDEEKAIYVRQIPKLYNQGLSYSEIAERFFNEGLRGKSDGRVSQEEIRKILFSDFYLGDFIWRGKRYKGQHSPLFTWLEVQKARNRSREKGHVHSTDKLKDKFIFKRLNFFCADCKELRITAESKIKYYKRTDREAEYILYHCTKSKGGWKACTQPSINREDLISEFTEKAVRPIEIDEELAEFLFEQMDKEFSRKKDEREKLLSSINRRLGQIELELKNLFELRIAGKILPLGDNNPDEIYADYLLEKEIEKKKLLESKKRIENNNGEWKQKASNFFSLCQNAENQFLKATEEKQYLFLSKITSNLFLDNRRLIVTHQFPFSALVKQAGHPNWLPR